MEEMAHLLGEYVFENCLDVGAGSGIFLEHLHAAGLIRKGTGVEVKGSCLRTINQDLRILSRDQLKNEKFDLIMFNDVLHHVVDPAAMIRQYAACFLKEHAFIFIKEMDDSSRLCTYFNRFHDLLMAGQWISEVPRRHLMRHMPEGFAVVKESRKRMFLYDHYFVLFRESAGEHTDAVLPPAAA